jgi:hypothetical protein
MSLGELVLAAARRADDARQSGTPCLAAERDLAVASAIAAAHVPPPARRSPRARR